MTSQFNIDCRHYRDRKLGTARLVDINDHQESAERHRQQTVRQTAETPQQLKQVIVSWTKLEKHQKERQTRFIIYCHRWGLLCRHHPLGRVTRIFTLNWVPTNPAGKSQRRACFRVIHMALLTRLLIINYVCYGGFRQLCTACPADINDYRESTNPHCQ